MKIRNITIGGGQIKLQMTSMIDVVFLLLAFFVITYKTPETEGDFNIRMPVLVQSNQMPDLDELTPVTVRLTADSSGNLNGIWFGGNPLGVDMQSLRQSVFNYIRVNNSISFQDALNGAVLPEFRDDLQIELDCAANLRYKYTMQAITAVTGYLNGENQVVKLVQKVKFTQPNSPGL